MNTRDVPLDEALAIGIAANDHARSIIKLGSTQIENNMLALKDYVSLYDAIGSKSKGLRGEIKSQKQKNRLEPDEDVAFYESVIAWTIMKQLGNCLELAIQALDYIISIIASSINAEVFRIKGGDHVFLVLNRDPKSKVEDPTTWGEAAVICDPWNAKVYEAKYYRSELKNFYVKEIKNEKHKIIGYKNYIEDFKKHKLVLVENLNVDFFRRMRTVDKLQSSFIRESNKLLDALTKHNEYLTQIKNGLINHYAKDTSHVEQMLHVIGDRITATNTLIKKIMDSMKSLSKDSSQLNYRDIRSTLYKMLEENEKNTQLLMNNQKMEIASAFNMILPKVDPSTIESGHVNSAAQLPTHLLNKDGPALENKWESLMKAIVENHSFNSIKLLIEQGVNINANDDDGNTAILFAAEKGRIDVVNYLIEQGAYINYENTGITACHLAANKGHLEVVKLLIEKGALVNAETHEGMNALQFAAMEGHTEVINYLINHGANVNASDTEGNTPLSLAVEAGHFEMVKLLIRAKGDVNAADITGNTPLINLAMVDNPSWEHEKIANYLIEQGAKVNAMNSEGSSALSLAAQGGSDRLNMVKLLIEAKADVNTVDKAGNTPFMNAGDLSIATYLENHGAAMNVKNKKNMTPLMTAASNGHVKIVQYLIKNGFSLNVTDIDGKTPLMLAAEGGHLEMVEWLVKKLRTDPDANRDDDLDLALMSAVANGHLELAKYLVQAGASLDAIDDSNNTLLILAAYAGHFRVVKWLIEQGADVNALNVDSFSALIGAASGGHMKVFKLLFATKKYSDEEVNQALLTAAKNDQLEVVKYLIENGININFTQTEYTPLMLASISGHLEMVEWLVEHGADVNVLNQDRISALKAAVLENQLEVAKFLVKKGGKLDIADSEGNTPFMTAVDYGHLKMVKWFVKKLRAKGEMSTALEQPNNHGVTALLMAVNNGNVEMAEFLVKKGAKLGVADSEGNTPLMIAADNGHLEMAKWLVKQGAVVNALNDEKRSALMLAVYEGHFEVAKYLLIKGANINAQDSKGATPLMTAALNGDFKIVQLLLQLGAKQDIVDNRGHSALFYASKHGGDSGDKIVHFLKNIHKVPPAPPLNLFSSTKSTTATTTSTIPEKKDVVSRKKARNE